MQLNSRTNLVLVSALALSLLATGCSAQWISTALADLPVLLQMSLNLGTLVTTLQSGKQLSPSEAADIQNIAAESGKDLSLLQTLYNQYKAAPNATNLQKIQDTIIDINRNLPALLQAAHIEDAALSARITTAVNLILTTVNSFASLIPQVTTSQATTAQAAAPQAAGIHRQAAPLVHAADLKKKWNEQVCSTTGKTEIDSAMSICPVR